MDETEVNVNVLEQEYLNRPPYVHPELVFQMLDFFFTDISNIVAEYVSPALEPTIAKTLAVRNNINFFDNRALSICYLAGLCCTNPKKALDLGIEISHEKEIMRNNIISWCGKYNIDELLDIVDEPFIFIFDADRIDLFIPEKFIAGKIRVCIFCDRNGENLIQTKHDSVSLAFIGNITKAELIMSR